MCGLAKQKSFSLWSWCSLHCRMPTVRIKEPTVKAGHRAGALVWFGILAPAASRLWFGSSTLLDSVKQYVLSHTSHELGFPKNPSTTRIKCQPVV